MPAGYRHLRAHRVIGRGHAVFERASDNLVRGEVQRRAGVAIRMSDVPLQVGTEIRMLLRLGPLSFRAPCRVVCVERTADRCGFAYGTLPGHPESGEERFELSCTPSGEVVFTITAFSRPGRWFTRLGAPLARVVQTAMIRRYLHALGG